MAKKFMRSSPARQHSECMCVCIVYSCLKRSAAAADEREKRRGRDLERERRGGGAESALRRYCRGFIQFISSLDVRTNIERVFFIWY